MNDRAACRLTATGGLSFGHFRRRHFPAAESFTERYSGDFGSSSTVHTLPLRVSFR